MKILLLGYRGYLGSFLYENIDADILTERNVYDNGNEYDYVINCIGKAILEYCELNIIETEYSNCNILNDIVKFYPSAKIINFSSHYVYDSEGLNKENAKTTGIYAYTSQKLRGEKIVKNGATFRLGKLFGGKASQNKLTEYIINNNNLDLDDTLFNPTSLAQVLKVINFEIETNTFNGVYNLANLGYTDHYEYGLKINSILGLNKNIIKVGKIERIFHNYQKSLMDVAKLNNIYSLTPWEEDLYKYLKQL